MDQQDMERTRRLAKALADRAWRRRGFLMLFRARPDRIQQGKESSGGHFGTVGRTGIRKLARAEGSGGGQKG